MYRPAAGDGPVTTYFEPRRIPRADAPRRFTCTRCDEPVDVFELPRPWVDPDRFVCIPCLDARHTAPAQLELVEPGRKPPARTETRAYDPSFAEIPY
jgi:hypothetical protein